MRESYDRMDFNLVQFYLNINLDFNNFMNLDLVLGKLILPLLLYLHFLFMDKSVS